MRWSSLSVAAVVVTAWFWASGAPQARAEGDVLIVSTVLDFSVEGLKETVTREQGLTFHVVIPKQGVLRAQLTTRLLSAQKKTLLVENYLYDSTTYGNRHLVHFDGRNCRRRGSTRFRWK